MGLIAVYLIIALFLFATKLMHRLPSLLGFLMVLPAYPFINAYANWHTKPALARLVVIIWGVFYIIILILFLLQS